MSVRDLALKIRINAEDKASSVLDSIKNNAGKIATAIAGFFSGKFLAASIEDAKNLETQYLKLDQTIKATGGAAGLTADEIVDMSKRLDEATIGSAEGFRDAANQLLTFKSVGKDSFETTLLLAQDLADSGFGSVETNAVQLGKALEYPVKGLTALSRSGVTFTDQQKELIKSLVETGRQAEAQGVILEAVSGQVGGVAEAAGKGLAGALDLVSKRFTDVREKIGGAIIPVLTDLNTRFANFIQRLSDSGAITRFSELLASALKNAGDAFLSFVEKIDFDALINSLRGFAEASTAAFNGTVQFIREYAGAITNLANVWLMLKFGEYISGLKNVATAVVMSTKAFLSGASATAAYSVATSASAAANTAAAAAASRLGLAIKAIPYAALAASIIDVSGKILQLVTAKEKLADAESSAADSSQLLQDRFKELSAATGITITSMADLDAAVKDGSIVFDEQQGYIAAAAQKLRDYNAEVLAATVSQAEFVGESGKTVGELTKIGNEAEITLQKFRAWSDGTDESVTSVTEGLKKLRDTDLSAFKQALIDAFDAGINKTDELNQALKNIETEEIRRAFSDLGVESAAQLQAAADKAKAAFEKIRSSGIATTEDLQRSFAAYAQTVIDANNGVVPAALQHEAAQYDVKIAYDETGKAIVGSTSSINDFHRAGIDGAAQHSASLQQLKYDYAAMQTAAEEAQYNAVSPSMNPTTRRDTVTSKRAWSKTEQDLIKAIDELGGNAEKVLQRASEEANKYFFSDRTTAGLRPGFREKFYTDPEYYEKQLQKELSQLQRSSSPSSGGKTVNVNFNVGGRIASGQFPDNEQTREMLRELERASFVMQ